MKNITQQIASTLKARRKERGWSLDKTASETGVSKAMLGQIERDESSPTIAILWKIASGFQISFSSFLENRPEHSQEPIYRSAEIHNRIPLSETFHVTALFPFDADVNCEIFIIELLPTCEQLSAPHEPGVIEHVIVVRGTVEILLNGVWKSLDPGEGLRFDAHQSHGYRNLTAEIACFYNIIHYPEKFSAHAKVR